MSITRALSVSLILSTAITVGACKGGDKAEVKNSAPAKALKIDKVGNSDIDSLFDAKPRKVKDADAEKALKMLGLDESGAAALSWDKREGKAGNYVYSGLTAKGEDGEAVAIDTMELMGVHTEDGAATFDTMIASGLSATSDDGTITLGSLKLSGPSPKLAAAITDGIARASEIDDLDDLDLDIDLDDDDIYFDAISFQDAKLVDDEDSAELKTFAWGEEDGSGKGIFLLEGLKIDTQEAGKPAVKISLGSANAQGINMDYVRSMSDRGKTVSSGPGAMGKLFNGNNPFAKTFDTASFTDLDVNVDTLSITSDGGQGSAIKKGDVTTIRQVLQPLTVKFSGEPTEKDMTPMYEALQTLGYDELVFTSSQTSVLNEKTDSVNVTDSYFDMKDGFRLGYNLEASGLAAIANEDLSDSEREAAAENISISSVNMSLADKSIMDRAFKLIAEKQGSSPMMLKMQAKGGLMMLSGLAKSPAEQEMAAQFSQALNNFIDDGGTLTVGLNPKTPLKAGQLKSLNPQTTDLEALGFYAKTE